MAPDIIQMSVLRNWTNNLMSMSFDGVAKEGYPSSFPQPGWGLVCNLHMLNLLFFVDFQNGSAEHQGQYG